MAEYVELHCHSCFSFREGASTPLELVLEARRLGYPALALTDHDGLAGAMEFAQAAKQWDMKPIIGAEVTLRGGIGTTAPRVETRGFKKGEAAGFIPQTMNNTHLTLLAETPRGYANLSRLLSHAHLNSPRDTPALDPDALAGHTEGLIALSGCREGEVPRLVAAGDFEGAQRSAMARVLRTASGSSAKRAAIS